MVRINDVPAVMKHAILAAEGERFYQHQGVDYVGVIRAAYSNLAAGGKRQQGASTITMQLARNFFLSSEKTLTRKIYESLLAFKIESELTKDQILEIYVNQIYLGQRAYGFAAASQIYFGKALKDVTPAEAAMLAGLPKAPSSFNPVVNPKRAKVRQVYVLRRMHELDYLNDKVFAEAQKQEIRVRRDIDDFPVHAEYAAEMVRQLLYERDPNDVYRRGFRVYTTISKRDQENAQAALRRGVLDYDRRHGYRGPEGYAELPPGASEEGLEDVLGTKVIKTFYPNGELKTEGQYWYDKLDGFYKEYYPNGKLWKNWTFSYGKEHGLSTWYFEDGKVSIGWNYVDGVKEGISKWYYESGELWAEQHYSGGVLEGITYTYYKTGELQGEWRYVDGLLQGISRTYFKNGDVEVERTFVDGKQNGKIYIYHENKRVAVEANFINDKIEGTVNLYDMAGSLRVKDEYVNDELLNRERYDYQGKFESKEEMLKNYSDAGAMLNETFVKDGVKEEVAKTYYDSGFLKEEIPYTNGVIDGVYITYYESGIVKSKVDYIDGEKKGMIKEYYPDGHLQLETVMKDGKKNGLVVTYYEDGSLKSMGTYVDDILDGDFKEYHKNGLLKSEATYVKGEIDGKKNSYYNNGTFQKVEYYYEGKLDSPGFIIQMVLFKRKSTIKTGNLFEAKSSMNRDISFLLLAIMISSFSLLSTIAEPSSEGWPPPPG